VPVTLLRSNETGKLVSMADFLVSEGLGLRERKPRYFYTTRGVALWWSGEGSVNTWSSSFFRVLRSSSRVVVVQESKGPEASPGTRSAGSDGEPVPLGSLAPRPRPAPCTITSAEKVSGPHAAL